MPPTIPQDFPDGSTTEVIQALIRDMQQELTNEEYDTPSITQYLPLINLGLFEIGRRENAAVVKESKRLGYISIGAATVALVISILGMVESSKFDEKQLALLREISKSEHVSEPLVQQNKLLEAISIKLDTQIDLAKADTLSVSQQAKLLEAIGTKLDTQIKLARGDKLKVTPPAPKTGDSQK